MKKSFSNFALLAIAGAAAFSSCSKEMDYYNPNAAAEEYAQNWENVFGTIDSQQDWNMATQVSATISINEDALSDYNLQLFTANPLYEDAYILADFEVTTDASGNASRTFNVDIPKGTMQLYAVRMDSHKRRLVRPVEVKDGVINASFGFSATRAANSNVDNDYEILAYNPPYTDEADVKTKLANYTKGTSLSANYNGVNDDFYDFTDAENIAIEISDTQKLPYFYYGDHANLKKFAIVIKNGGVLDFNKQNNIYTYRNEDCIDVEIIVESGGTLYMNTDVGQLGLVRLTVLSGGSVTGTILSTGAAQGSSTTTDGIYNAGTINVTSLYMANANIHNTGVVKVTNIETPNGGTFYNNGRVECETVGASSDNWSTSYIKTNCLFRCTNSVRTGGITVGSNAALEAVTMQIGGTVELNKNSILRASEQILLGTAPLYGPTSSGHALLTTPTLAFFSDAKGADSEITGNIYVEYNNICGLDGQASTYWQGVVDGLILTNNNNGYDSKVAKVGKAPIRIEPTNANASIEEADCVGEGNTPDETGGGGNETPNYWIIACEDLGNTDDWDFNDVVLQVSHVAGKTTAKVKPLAAGGTLKTTIKHDEMENKEIHAWLGVTDETYPMINTGAGTTGSGDEVEITVASDYTVTNNMGGFSIEVEGKESTVTITTPEIGTAPAMMCLPGDWKWPKERTSIKTAYPSFVNWSGDVDATDWITADDVDSSLLYQ